MQRSTQGTYVPVPVPLDPPTAPDALPDIPGGQHNLLPVAVLGRPLRIDIPMWEYSCPTPELSEWIILYWNGSEVEKKTWYDDIPPDELYVDVPVQFLEHGVAAVTYLAHGFNGAEVGSLPLSLTIDKVAPVLGDNQGSLVFDEEVLRDGVTARYLENNVLQALVPSYQTPAVADTLIVYWDREPFADEEVDRYELKDPSQPISIVFSKEMILARGDGKRYVHYKVCDRAGNLSAGSRPVTLEVAATPIPRSLPPVLIEKAEGWGAQQTLTLNDFYPPLLVEVPASAVIYPDETLAVVWGAPGTAGYFTTSTPYNGQERLFEIPTQYVLAQSTHTVTVLYRVSDNANALDSDTLALDVKARSEQLPQPELHGANADGFSLGKAPANVPIRLGTWPLIAEGQQVSIQLTGVLPGGSDAPAYDVLSAHALSATEADEGIGMRDDVTVPKTHLATLWIDHNFTITASVSFDEGATWVAFRPVLSLPLRD